MNDKTTIAVSVETKRKLMELGSKGDTYDTIIMRLIRFYEGGKDGSGTNR